MSNANVNPSDDVALLDAIDPDAYAAGTETTAWISIKEVYRVMATIFCGTIVATGLVDAKLQQALDSSGTGVKDITGKAITQVLAATGSDEQYIINLLAEELDIDNDFNHVRLSVTMTTAGADLSAVLQGLTMRHGPATKQNAATVTEIIV